MYIHPGFYIIITLILINLFLPFFMSNILLINSKYYLNYLLWINVLILLYFILPKSVGNIFG